MQQIKAWTHFSFQGRKDKYSKLKWHWWHFNAADYDGAHYKDIGKDGNEYEIWMDSHQWLIDQFLCVRKEYAHCDQYDYFDHPNCIGWTRMGVEGEQRGMATQINSITIY